MTHYFRQIRALTWGDADVEPAIQRHLSLIKPGMRDLITVAIHDFIDPDQVEATVDLILLWTAGVVLSAIEHPEILDSGGSVESPILFRLRAA